MKDLNDLVRGWIVKADSDLQTARLLIDSSGPYDTACFHSQQAIEKLLKALLAFHKQPIPHTHDLEELQRMVLELQELPDLAELELFEATGYAVLARYDLSFWPDQETSAAALALSEKVHEIILTTLPEECHPSSPSDSSAVSSTSS